MNAANISLNSLFQVNNATVSRKVADTKDRNAFDTVMQHGSSQKMRFEKSKAVSAQKTSIKSSDVSDKKMELSSKMDGSSQQDMKINVSNKDELNQDAEDVKEFVQMAEEPLQGNEDSLVTSDVSGHVLEEAAKVLMTDNNGETLQEMSAEDILNFLGETLGLQKETITNLLEDAGSFLEELKEKIQGVLKESTGLDEKEIQTVLEQLGISLTDLLNPSHLQQFVLENAKEDMTALLTDENLFQQFGKLLKDMGTIEKEAENILHINPQDMEKFVRIVEKMVLPEENVNLSKEFQQIPKTLTESGSKDNTYMADISPLSEQIPEETENFTEKVAAVTSEQTVIKGILEEVSERTETEGSKQSQQTSLEKVSVIVEQEDTQGHGKEEFSQKQPQHKTQETAAEQFVQQLVQSQPQTEEVFSNQAEQLQQMREIVSQVVEQIKINIKPDASGMEIQLNPENLGKVNVSVVSKNGQMTARFITENELAKTALESQMQQLKDNLQNQGLKVDAIEVSVSDFKFEQSSNMNGEQQRQQSENRKKTPRKIDMSLLEDGIDDLSEEDSLTAQVMLDNGNTVDYTA